MYRYISNTKGKLLNKGNQEKRKSIDDHCDLMHNSLEKLFLQILEKSEKETF